MHEPSPFNGRVLLAGASGLVGQELLSALREQSADAALHLLLRRPPSFALAPGVTAQVVDFALLPPLPAAVDAYCALGTTLRAAGSRAAFRAVDLDAVLRFAHAARAAGVRRFAVVSALGADPGASNFYSRVKGRMEASLSAIGFDTLIIARPSLLVGDRGALGQPRRWAESLALAVARPLAPLLPFSLRPIKAEVVARAMLEAMRRNRPGVQVFDSTELQQLGH